jgi:SpoVK/Ycf46/Vps4 family AAA+-type ATPase
LRLDFGALYDKWLGETERKLREALKFADSMAPCVLWMDEIEQAIVSGLYEAHAAGRPLNTVYVLTETVRTRPLSVVMAEKISALRDWAAARTVSAN